MTEPEFDVCDCPELPVMKWRLPDTEWVDAYTITADRNAEADRAEYARLGASAWIAICPRCRRTYARGIG